FCKQSLSFLISHTLILKGQHILGSLLLSRVSLAKVHFVLRALSHVVLGEEAANFCCFCSKVLPKDERKE
ncbi:hypothetical protein M3J43_26790, partial [Escherichia coli]|nr:hypothetical protein [Escherichia coli]